MLKRLSWKRLRNEYRGQWVELVAFDWDWASALPTWGTVRHHAEDRKKLMSAIERSGSVRDAVILYVGYPESTLRIDTSRSAVY